MAGAWVGWNLILSNFSPSWFCSHSSNFFPLTLVVFAVLSLSIAVEFRHAHPCKGAQGDCTWLQRSQLSQDLGLLQYFVLLSIRQHAVCWEGISWWLPGAALNWGMQDRAEEQVCRLPMPEQISLCLGAVPVAACLGPYQEQGGKVFKVLPVTSHKHTRFHCY